MSWYEPLSLVDTCGFVTEAMVRVRNCDIPNVFTPDDLGGNNSFRIRGLSNLEGTRLVVLNRYGVKFGRTKPRPTPNRNWRGTAAPQRRPRGRWTLPVVPIRPDGQRQHGSLHVFRSP